MVWRDPVPASFVKFLGLGQALGYGFSDDTLVAEDVLTIPTARVTQGIAI